MQKLKIRTMEQLSAAISVSRPTLSRFFQDPDSVRSSTRIRIEEALETVDYRPRRPTSPMRSKSGGCIGVIIPRLNDPFFTTLIEAIEACAIPSDHTVVTASSDCDPALEARAAQNMLSLGVAGVIIAPIGEASSLDALTQLKKACPMVFVDSRPQNQLRDVDFIGTNNHQSISLIIEYLCRSGEAPAFLGSPRPNSNSLEREQAYIRKMMMLGHEPAIIPAPEEARNAEPEDYAYRLMDAQFSQGNFTRGTILCANDRLAIGAIRAANRHHLFAAPDKTSTRFRIAGHDDHALSAFVSPSLTTVTQNIPAIANAATQQLLDHIHHRNLPTQPVTLTFDAELRLRDSA
jgi:DNA-binding LacI/PurR family transcriptional regulator